MRGTYHRFVRYWLDAFDRVAAFDREWLRFAAENGASELTEENVLGRSIYSFISDESVRHLWMLLLRRARQGVVVQVPIRCDSPEYRRNVEILVTMDGPDLLLITTNTTSAVRRREVGLLRRADSREDSSVRICSWCKRIEVAGRGWCEIEEADELLRSLSGAPLPALVQGSCTDCYPSLVRRGEGSAPPDIPDRRG